MAILLQYNKNTSYDIDELRLNTDIKENLLISQLDYLVDSKILFLVENVDGVKKYELNFEFKRFGLESYLIQI
jgi:hypothetical protein